MKIALDWIGEYLSPVPAAAVAADALMNAGLPVESVAEAAGWTGGSKVSTQVLDVEVTSNRTDCFCHVGLARELSAVVGGQFRMPAVALKESGVAATSLARVEVEDAVGCPYYSARLIRGVKVGPSPEWLRVRLESVGLRPVNNVVDVTNYVLLELGQPLHAFDLDKLAGGGEKRIVVRRAARGEKMVAIDGKEYGLEPSMLVIADAAPGGPVAIAGVMGGKGTEVGEGTVNILLESARFEPLTIRTTSRALGLKSESSYRFERGIDPTMAEAASRRAAQLILEVAGGELAAGAVTAGEVAHVRKQVSMRYKRFEDVIGIPIAKERATSILSALGFAPWTDEGSPATPDDDCLYTRVPPHRLDVEREIDLIEEVARVHGYEHVPTLDRVRHAVTPESVREKAMRAVRQALTEAGFSEAVTVTFVTEDQAKGFEAGGVLIHPQHAGWKSDVLRPSLLPSLLAARRTNQYAGMPDGHLFETASVFEQPGDAVKNAPLERRMLAAVAGDVSTLTGLVRLIVQRLNPRGRVETAPADFAFYVRGAAAQVNLKGKGAIGHVGLLSAELQKKYDLRQAAAGMELDLESLLAIYEPVRRAVAVPRFPGVTRDLSVVVAEGVRWSEVRGALAEAKLACLDAEDGIGFVTTFRNAAIGAGKKSLTLTLQFRDAERTLTSEEVDGEVKRAVEVLAGRFGAVLRA